MQQVYVCRHCDNVWQGDFFHKPSRCPSCGKGNILGAKIGAGCVCKGLDPGKIKQANKEHTHVQND
jgi:hypothetical protein